MKKVLQILNLCCFASAKVTNFQKSLFLPRLVHAKRKLRWFGHRLNVFFYSKDNIQQ